MASTVLGGQLTELHYRQQTVLRADTLQTLVRLFPALDLSSFDAVERSWPALEEGLTALVNRQHGLSSGLSINYYELFRAAEGIVGRTTPLLAEALAAEQVATSLKVTGPYTAKHLIAVKDVQAAEKTFARLSGSVSRLVSTGGRDTLDRTVQADKRALGWARVTSGRACAFCRMLASRGAVYKTKGSSRFRAHDHCGCTSEPIFRQDQPLPANSAKDLALYREVTAGLSGDDAIAAFRRAVESGR